MLKPLKIKIFKKHVFSNTFIWRNVGLYYSLPIFYKCKLKLPKFKLNYRFRGHYYEKVVEDNVYSYSSGFGKDSCERLRFISMIKKHRKLLWVDDKGQYLPYTLCDMIKLSYKDNNVLRFTIRYKINQAKFWMLDFYPKNNYKHFISYILKKQNLFISAGEYLNWISFSVLFIFAACSSLSVVK